jgi:hypothetical protein
LRWSAGARRFSALPVSLPNLDYFALDAPWKSNPLDRARVFPTRTDGAGVVACMCAKSTLTLTALTHPLAPYSHRWYKIFIARRVRPVVERCKFRARNNKLQGWMWDKIVIFAGKMLHVVWHPLICVSGRVLFGEGLCSRTVCCSRAKASEERAHLAPRPLRSTLLARRLLTARVLMNIQLIFNSSRRLPQEANLRYC